MTGKEGLMLKGLSDAEFFKTKPHAVSDSINHFLNPQTKVSTIFRAIIRNMNSSNVTYCTLET